MDGITILLRKHWPQTTWTLLKCEWPPPSASATEQKLHFFFGSWNLCSFKNGAKKGESIKHMGITHLSSLNVIIIQYHMYNYSTWHSSFDLKHEPSVGILSSWKGSLEWSRVIYLLRLWELPQKEHLVHQCARSNHELWLRKKFWK